MSAEYLLPFHVSVSIVTCRLINVSAAIMICWSNNTFSEPLADVKYPPWPQQAGRRKGRTGRTLISTTAMTTRSSTVRATSRRNEDRGRAAFRKTLRRQLVTTRW